MPKRNSQPTVQTTAWRNRKEPVDFGSALVEAFLTNDRINQILIDSLEAAIWREQPPCAKRRNIATTFAHIHNVRAMRIGMSMKGIKPAKLERADVTPREAKEALAESARTMAKLIHKSVESGGHVPAFRPDVVALVCSAIGHEAHHRGQICHWARELGAPLTQEQQLKIWEWDKVWREVLV